MTVEGACTRTVKPPTASTGAVALIQLVTVEDCSEPCTHCRMAEDVLRAVLAVAGIRFPEHHASNRSESLLADGRSIQVLHLPCMEAESLGFDVADAPYLLIDQRCVARVDTWGRDTLASVLLDALFPEGLPDLWT